MHGTAPARYLSIIYRVVQGDANQSGRVRTTLRVPDFQSAMTDLHCRVVGLQSTALLSLLTAHISMPGAAPGASRSQGGRSPGELHRGSPLQDFDTEPARCRHSRAAAIILIHLFSPFREGIHGL